MSSKHHGKATNMINIERLPTELDESAQPLTRLRKIDGCIALTMATRQILHAFPWTHWDSRPTLIVDVGQIPEAVVRDRDHGVLGGQTVCRSFAQKTAEELGQWIDKSSVHDKLKPVW